MSIRKYVLSSSVSIVALGEPLAKLLSLDFLHQSPQISQDEIEHAVLDAIDASEEVPYGILAQNAAF